MVQRSSERQNLKLIRQDRYQACETVICQHYKSIYSFMVYLTDNSSLAEDLTQETFTAAWAGIDNFRSGASLKTWLHRIAYNKFIDSKRQTKRSANLITNLSKDVTDAAQTLNPLNCLIAMSILPFFTKRFANSSLLSIS
jgi:RNA polymerase sigma factor (sigma-70 family)